MLEVIHPSNAQWVCLGFNGEKEREEEGGKGAQRAVDNAVCLSMVIALGKEARVQAGLLDSSLLS